MANDLWGPDPTDPNAPPPPVPMVKSMKMNSHQKEFIKGMPQEPGKGIVIKHPHHFDTACALMRRGYGYWGHRENGHLTFFLTLAGREKVKRILAKQASKGSTNGNQPTTT